VKSLDSQEFSQADETSGFLRIQLRIAISQALTSRRVSRLLVETLRRDQDASRSDFALHARPDE